MYFLYLIKGIQLLFSLDLFYIQLRSIFPSNRMHQYSNQSLIDSPLVPKNII
jgi:hypothetical protein